MRFISEMMYAYRPCDETEVEEFLIYFHDIINHDDMCRALYKEDQCTHKVLNKIFGPTEVAAFGTFILLYEMSCGAGDGIKGDS